MTEKTTAGLKNLMSAISRIEAMQTSENWDFNLLLQLGRQMEDAIGEVSVELMSGNITYDDLETELRSGQTEVGINGIPAEVISELQEDFDKRFVRLERAMKGKINV
jgi:hypothetical protein